MKQDGAKTIAPFQLQRLEQVSERGMVGDVQSRGRTIGESVDFFMCNGDIYLKAGRLLRRLSLYFNSDRMVA